MQYMMYDMQRASERVHWPVCTLASLVRLAVDSPGQQNCRVQKTRDNLGNLNKENTQVGLWQCIFLSI